MELSYKVMQQLGLPRVIEQAARAVASKEAVNPSQSMSWSGGLVALSSACWNRFLAMFNVSEVAGADNIPMVLPTPEIWQRKECGSGCRARKLADTDMPSTPRQDGAEVNWDAGPENVEEFDCRI